MPRFSILMPTRNRAHLLEYALQSSLHQWEDDYEVVVSDNGSSDRTADVVRERGDTRVRYIRTPESMPMADHWEWALDHVAGEYVMVLCDDDAVSPALLSRVSAIIDETGAQVVGLEKALYWHPSWPDPAQRNTLAAGPYTGEVVEYDSRQMLVRLSRNIRDEWTTPRMLNCFCHRDVIARIRQRGKGFFLNPSPDIGACCLIMASVPRYLWVSEPLFLAGVAEESIGRSTAFGGEATQAFLRELREPFFQQCPLEMLCLTTTILESFLRAKAVMPGEFAGIDFDPVALCHGCYADLDVFKSNGKDIAADLARLRAYRWRQGPRVQAALASRFAVEAARRSRLRPLLRALKHALARSLSQPECVTGERLTLHGEDAGFSNIYECAQYLPKLQGIADFGLPAKTYHEEHEELEAGTRGN